MFSLLLHLSLIEVGVMTSVSEICDELEIGRGSITNARIGSTTSDVTQLDLEWVMQSELIEREPKPMLARPTDQADELKATEQARAKTLQTQWQDRFKLPPELPSVRSFIQIACETEARKADIFQGAQAQFRAMLASSVVAHFPVLQATEPAPFVILRLKPKGEVYELMQAVSVADSEWLLQGRNAGLSEPATLQIQSYYRSVQGDALVGLLSNTPQGQTVFLEYQREGRSVGSEAVSIKFEAPPPAESLVELVVGGKAMVRWPLGEFLAAPYASRDRKVAQEAIEWPVWLSQVIKEATGKDVVGWYPDRIASEIVIGAGRLTQQREIKTSEVLSLVERWCDFEVKENKILLRPRYVLWEESMMLDAPTWERASTNLDDRGHLSPTELGRIALEYRHFGRAHPAETILGMVGKFPIAPFQVGTWNALAAVADGMNETRVLYPGLSPSLRAKMDLEVPSVRASLLRQKPLASDDVSLRGTLRNASFWLTPSTTEVYTITEPFVWNYDVVRPYSRIMVRAYVDYVRQRYQGQVTSPMIRPTAERGVVLNGMFEGTEILLADAILAHEIVGPEEPLVPRP